MSNLDNEIDTICPHCNKDYAVNITNSSKSYQAFNPDKHAVSNKAFIATGDGTYKIDHMILIYKDYLLGKLKYV